MKGVSTKRIPRVSAGSARSGVAPGRRTTTTVARLRILSGRCQAPISVTLSAPMIRERPIFSPRVWRSSDSVSTV